MNKLNPKVDAYLAQGCGRCNLFNTPECKVHTWHEELRKLREIVLDCGLNEELKWKQPVYTFEGGNVVIVTAFKEYASLSFFKGALLKDPSGVLVKQGENVQSAKIAKFTDVQQIIEMEDVLKAYIQEAIEVEKGGLKVELKKHDEYEIPEELQAKLNADEVFKAAFEALTPGRQRGYYIFFSQPKQSKTRFERIEKMLPKIFAGKGYLDR